MYVFPVDMMSQWFQTICVHTNSVKPFQIYQVVELCDSGCKLIDPIRYNQGEGGGGGGGGAGEQSNCVSDHSD